MQQPEISIHPLIGRLRLWRLGILIPVIFYASQVIAFCILTYFYPEVTVEKMSSYRKKQ